MNIEIKYRLSAYSKGALPDLSKVVLEVEDTGLPYVRKYKDWVALQDVVTDQVIELPVGIDSGLILKEVPDERNKYTIQVNQELLTESEFIELQNLVEGRVYYIIDNLTPEQLINGGTAFSDGNNEYVIDNEYSINYEGGIANSSFEIRIVSPEIIINEVR